MWQRFRRWLNIDHIVDLCVDLFLILFDVLSSPILIVMRLLRWIVGSYLLDGVKHKIKRVLHWASKKPIWLQFIIIPAIIAGVICVLIFIWIFGQAFGEFVMEEWAVVHLK